MIHRRVVFYDDMYHSRFDVGRTIPVEGKIDHQGREEAVIIVILLIHYHCC